MQDRADTIAAVATPPGQGGVGVVRLSGPDARRIAAALFRPGRKGFADFTPRHLHFGRLCDGAGRVLDQCLAVVMPGPASFTGEDVAEFHCHGAPAVLAAALEACLAAGARPAAPGEFTKRAFLNGKMDLSQAEAVAELIAAPPAPKGPAHSQALARLEGRLGRLAGQLRAELSDLSRDLCVELDFSEDDNPELAPAELGRRLEAVSARIRGLLTAHERARPWREGAMVVLAGVVNAGKSTLFNALAGRERAIVSSCPGTTRDYLEAHLTLEGLPVTLVDTAGLRATGDIIEAEGVRRSRRLAETADLVVLVVEAGRGLLPEERELVERIPPERLLVAANKCDVACAELPLPAAGALALSAATGEGLEPLARAVAERLCAAHPAEPEALAPNDRQRQALATALAELEAVARDLAAGQPYDILGLGLERARLALGLVTGELGVEDILDEVFAAFCIGK